MAPRRELGNIIREDAMNRLLAPCGHYCDECEAYQATLAGDESQLKDLAERHSRQYGKSIEPESLRCSGCLSDGARCGFCGVCAIRSCAISKGYANCAGCAEFPCGKGSFIWKEGSKSLETLLALRGGNSI